MPFTTLQGAIEEESVPFKMWGGGATRSMVEVSSEGKIWGSFQLIDISKTSIEITDCISNHMKNYA